VVPFQPPNSTTRLRLESYALAAKVRGGGDVAGDSCSQFTGEVVAATCSGAPEATIAAAATAASKRQERCMVRRR
jgi:hypothetical protein